MPEITQKYEVEAKFQTFFDNLGEPNNEDFERSLESLNFKDELSKALIELYSADQEQAREMKNKIGELNRPSFKNVLKEMIKEIKAPIKIADELSQEDDEVDILLKDVIFLFIKVNLELLKSLMN